MIGEDTICGVQRELKGLGMSVFCEREPGHRGPHEAVNAKYAWNDPPPEPGPPAQGERDLAVSAIIEGPPKCKVEGCKRWAGHPGQHTREILQERYGRAEPPPYVRPATDAREIVVMPEYERGLKDLAAKYIGTDADGGGKVFVVDDLATLQKSTYDRVVEYWNEWDDPLEWKDIKLDVQAVGMSVRMLASDTWEFAAFRWQQWVHGA